MRKWIIFLFLLSLLSLELALGQGQDRVVFFYFGGHEYLSAVNGGGDEIIREIKIDPGEYEKFKIEYLANIRGDEFFFISTISGYYLTMDDELNLIAPEKFNRKEYSFYLELSEDNTWELKHKAFGGQRDAGNEIALQNSMINNFQSEEDEQFSLSARQITVAPEPFSELGKPLGIIMTDAPEGIEENLYSYLDDSQNSRYNNDRFSDDRNRGSYKELSTDYTNAIENRGASRSINRAHGASFLDRMDAVEEVQRTRGVYPKTANRSTRSYAPRDKRYERSVYFDYREDTRASSPFLIPNTEQLVNPKPLVEVKHNAYLLRIATQEETFREIPSEVLVKVLCYGEDGTISIHEISNMSTLANKTAQIHFSLEEGTRIQKIVILNQGNGLEVDWKVDWLTVFKEDEGKWESIKHQPIYDWLYEGGSLLIKF